jgi:hypothetical protein
MDTPSWKYFAPTMVFLVLGCNAVDSVVSPRQVAHKLQSQAGNCEPTRPEMSGMSGDEGTCVQFTFFEEQQDFATGAGPAANYELVWSGQSFSSFPEPEEDWRCHRTATGVTFKLYIIEYGEYATFDVPVAIPIASDDGYTAFGIPKGSYALPENIEIRSSNPPGKYAIRGGFLKAVCFDFTVRTGMGIRVEGGWHRWYDYTGWPYLAPGGWTNANDGRGWSWTTSSTGYRNGGGMGWQNALDKYMNGDGCTRGWEIWIDGNQKCDSFGNAVT